MGEEGEKSRSERSGTNAFAVNKVEKQLVRYVMLVLKGWVSSRVELGRCGGQGLADAILRNTRVRSVLSHAFTP